MRSRASSLFFLCLIAGCANHATVKGALTTDERREFVEQTGALIPQRLKDPFLAGKAAEGMTKELVIFLYGQPDRTENNRYGISWGASESDTSAAVDMRDSIWNYFLSDSVSVKRGLVFAGDTLSRITGDINR